MAYPTGSGSEILRRGTIHHSTNVDTAFAFDGTDDTDKDQVSNAVQALHIVTILNIIFQEQGSEDKILDLLVRGPAGDNIYLLSGYPIGSKETFVFSERIVLIGGDKLITSCGTSANVDIYYSYIDQNWID